MRLRRDVSCGRDVRFAREQRNTSHLCDGRKQHHCGGRHCITCAGGANITLHSRAFFNDVSCKHVVRFGVMYPADVMCALRVNDHFITFAARQIHHCSARATQKTVDFFMDL